MTDREHEGTRADAILRAYGCQAPTLSETRAYVGVLDRMGAFSTTEREILEAAGYFDDGRTRAIEDLAWDMERR
jgi:hypothetical protein